MKRPPMTEKQKRAFRYLLKHPYSILAMDPRLGKSRVLIKLQRKLKLNCLIICPGYLVPNWYDQIRFWFGKKPVITTIMKGSDIYDVFDSDFVIVSYNLAMKAPWFFEWADMIGLDEGHHLKSMEAKRTEFVHKNVYENSVPRLHILTGTIIKNRVKEFYSPLALTYYNPKTTDPEFLKKYPSEIDFADEFSYREQYKLQINNKWVTIVKWSGLRNLQRLKKHLKGRYIRIRADAGDLPPITPIEVMVSNNPDKKLLEAFTTFFMEDGKGSVKPDIKAEAALKKVPFTIKYVEDLLVEKECALVYSDHRAPVEEIAKHFGVVAVTGKMTAKRRSQVVKDFQAGKTRLIVATVGALKEGSDIYRSEDIVFNDYPWTPGDITQVINRIRKLGQKKPCTVHKIIGSPQDEYIISTLEAKIEVIERAT